MSLAVIAVGCYIASAIAFVRYALGRASASKTHESLGPPREFIGFRLDRQSLVRLQGFHLIVGWAMLGVAVAASLGALLQ